MFQCTGKLFSFLIHSATPTNYGGCTLLVRSGSGLGLASVLTGPHTIPLHTLHPTHVPVGHALAKQDERTVIGHGETP